MKPIPATLLTLGLATSAVAHAEVTYFTRALTEATLPSLTPPVHHYQLIESGENPDGATAQSSLPASTAPLGGSGTSAASAAGLNAGVMLGWDTTQPADPLAQGIVSTSARARDDSVDAAHSGRVRFTLDYELHVTDPAATAAVDFQLNYNLIDPISGWINTQYVSFSDSLYGTSLPTDKTGSWTSDWISFSGREELAALTSSPYSNYPFAYQVGIYTWTGLPQAGAAEAGSWGTLHFRYEIAPVPEPETWALMGAGTGLLAWASRRRAAKKAVIG